jgi:hypothetical protein
VRDPPGRHRRCPDWSLTSPPASLRRSAFSAVTHGEFLEFFQQYGEVIDSVVITDRVTKRSRGFGFVTFACEVSRVSFSFRFLQVQDQSID